MDEAAELFLLSQELSGKNEVHPLSDATIMSLVSRIFLDGLANAGAHRRPLTSRLFPSGARREPDHALRSHRQLTVLVHRGLRDLGEI